MSKIESNESSISKRLPPPEQDPKRRPERATRERWLFGSLALAALGALVYVMATPKPAAAPAATAAKTLACSERLAAGRSALARGELALARQAVSQAPNECAGSAEWIGNEAELLVLEGQVAAGKKLADQALAKDKSELGARRAICLRLMQAGEYVPARECFSKLLSEAPNDLATVFHAATVAQAMGHYRGSREGFLKVLRLEPRHVEARYRLFLITHSIQARAESENHAKKLEQIARPDDPRLARVKQLLAETPSTAGRAASSAASTKP